MKEFTTTKLTRNFSEVAHTATREPVAIVQRGKARWVLMSITDYEARAMVPDPRRAYHVSNMPDDHREMLEQGLSRLIDGEGYDD